MRTPPRLLPLLCAIASIALASCSSYPEAEVVDRSYDPVPVRRAVPAQRVARGEHVVVRGDTLHAIAFARGVSVRELAQWNGLGPPYTI
ncbi:MAG TPA: LysM peptidoglycan-binding domain-containing protein, partial [Xanthomonadales bacterium]|nr:LysM peptidoglycan-binding domain-containing protein [Xanthomonadales bacterium]